MIKAILLDADGVTLKKHPYFSEIYAQKYNVPLEKITPFFKEKFRDCQKGESDIKDALTPYLPDWEWNGSVDELLDFWFTADTEPDEGILLLVDKLRAENIRCYLATDQEQHRANYVKGLKNFGERFDGLFISCELGFQKSEPEFFASVLQKLNLSAEEVAYFDDDPDNADTASKFNIQSYLFTNIENFISQLNNINIHV